MRYQIQHTTKYSYGDVASVCQNLVRLTPRELPWQRVASHRLLVTPEPTETSWRMDFFGNRVTYFALDEPHHGMAVTATTELALTPRLRPSADGEAPKWTAVAAELANGAAARDPDVVQFRFASPYAPIDATFAQYAQSAFGASQSIVAAVESLMARIHADFRFDQRATHVGTSVTEAFAHRAGVCQDFAHVAIACLRSVGLAARYVSGYLRTAPPPGKPRLVGVDASHAWVSAYCGSLGWFDWDPTNNMAVGLDHVTVAYGRDYGDICPIQGVLLGGGSPAMTVGVDVEPLGD